MGESSLSGQIPLDFRNNAIKLYSPATPVMCHSGGISKQDDGCAGELARHFRSGSIASVCLPAGYFRSAPINGHHLTSPVGPFRAAMNGLMHRSNSPLHSITLSARSRIDVATSILSAFAVLRFTTSSNFVGCSTGRSAGFSPRKTRSA
jgi:hypothetical protein